MKPVELAPPARGEFDAAVDWYESQAEGVGQRFVDSVGETLENIAEAPLACPVWGGRPALQKGGRRTIPVRNLLSGTHQDD
ncbi:MAG: type II toxin-antitoxin system RelE/ParE family toxin [Myxococcales bacterium]|nr:type II toxin-antitoxin system RelE/ParE family toxin [Myxococcales bacterium]